MRRPVHASLLPLSGLLRGASARSSQPPASLPCKILSSLPHRADLVRHASLAPVREEACETEKRCRELAPAALSLRRENEAAEHIPLLIRQPQVVCPAIGRKRCRNSVTSQCTIGIQDEAGHCIGRLISGEQHRSVRMHNDLIRLSPRRKW